MSEEHKKKLKERRKSRILSPESRAKLSSSLIGRKLSPESREKIRKALTTPGNPKDLCEICGHPSLGGPLVQDHNHSNGKKRGRICNPCNRGLGHFRDTPVFLHNAIKYLLRWNHKDG